MINRNIEVKVKPTPSELAACFCEMDGDEQAAFFGKIGEIAEDWDKSLCFQMQAISDSDEKGIHATNVMAIIGEYS